jgi:hypothetical protein
MWAAVFSCGQRTTFGHLLDDRCVVGAEITEEIIDADLFQAFEQVIRG